MRVLRIVSFGDHYGIGEAQRPVIAARKKEPRP